MHVMPGIKPGQFRDIGDTFALFQQAGRINKTVQFDMIGLQADFIAINQSGKQQFHGACIGAAQDGITHFGMWLIDHAGLELRIAQ